MEARPSSRFPVITAVPNILRFVGWVLVGLGVIAAFAGGFSPGLRFGFLGGFETLIFSIVIVLNGLFIVAAGESIGVLFAIEANTRKAAQQVNE